MIHNAIKRRQFIQTAITGALSIAVIANAAQAATPAPAPALTPIEATNPTAKALGYVEDSSKVDAKKYPKHVATQICQNCSLVKGDASGARVGCSLFPGKSVNAKGWCASWAKKA
jgi:formylmethanofuran:tetrahydromethanopterin formyltransferase